MPQALDSRMLRCVFCFKACLLKFDVDFTESIIDLEFDRLNDSRLRRLSLVQSLFD